MFTEHVFTQSRSLTSRVLGSSLIDLLTGPHGVDRFTEVVDGTWTINSARAEIVVVKRTTPRSTTLLLRPNRAFAGFRAGQHVNAAIEIDGRRYTRLYSPASSERSAREVIELTVGVHEQGLVSNFLRDHAQPGVVIGLDFVAGDFVLPDERPDRIVFISGGSGITPVISMLRTLCDEEYAGEVTFVHYARTAAEAAYREELRVLAQRHPNLTVLHGFTRDTHGSDLAGRFSADTVDVDGAELFACGPPALIDAIRDIHGDEHLSYETFVPPVFEIPENPEGGEISFTGSNTTTTDDGRTLLEQAEAAGLSPESGCRMGICHSCTCRKTSGAVRNLLTGDVSTTAEEDVQICISVPVGDVELAI
jgi:ferredoxin-NADP reductase